MPTTAEPELAFLLDAYRFRDPYLSEKFDAVARPLLYRMAKKHGWGLLPDAIDDVVQEAFLALANPEVVGFNPKRGTASQYLLGRLLNAVKTVQIAHGLRRTGTDFEKETQRAFIPLDDLQVPSVGIPLAAIHARHVVRKMFNGMGADVEQVCRRVWAEGEAQTAVAVDLGMSRFALARKLAGVKALSARYAA